MISSDTSIMEQLNAIQELLDSLRQEIEDRDKHIQQLEDELAAAAQRGGAPEPIYSEPEPTPSMAPSAAPSVALSEPTPSMAPSAAPSVAPSEPTPSMAPSAAPSVAPSEPTPSMAPSAAPSGAPSEPTPSMAPSAAPSEAPSSMTVEVRPEPEVNEMPAVSEDEDGLTLVLLELDDGAWFFNEANNEMYEIIGSPDDGDVGEVVGKLQSVTIKGRNYVHNTANNSLYNTNSDSEILDVAGFIEYTQDSKGNSIPKAKLKKQA